MGGGAGCSGLATGESNRSDEAIKKSPRRPSRCVCRRGAPHRSAPCGLRREARRGGEGREGRGWVGWGVGEVGGWGGGGGGRAYGRSAGCGAAAPLRSLPRACAPASHMLTAPAAGAHTPQRCGSALHLW